MTDLIAVSNAAADAAEIPRLLLLACACAESGLNPFARRPARPEDDERYWPDVSGGAWQQAVRWDPDYSGDGGYPGPVEIKRVLALQYDPARSARVAAANLRARYRPEEDDAVFKALCRYNWPAGGGKPASAEVAANYRRGIAEATSLLGQQQTPSPPGRPSVKLSEVLARARSRIGDPYVWGGKVPGSFDCSGFVSWCYGGKVPSFTDAILGATERVDGKAPGDIVLYEYQDASQPGVRFPHVGLFLDDATTLDARGGEGVGVHGQLPRSRATRYYRRLPGVVVDTAAGANPVANPPATAPSSDAETIAGLRTAVAHLADVVVPRAVAAAAARDEVLAEAKKIREQFVGPKV